MAKKLGQSEVLDVPAPDRANKEKWINVRNERSR
jgi:hypothetical protein